MALVSLALWPELTMASTYYGHYLLWPLLTMTTTHCGHYLLWPLLTMAGAYLSLTGAALGGAEMFELQLATHYTEAQATNTTTYYGHALHRGTTMTLLLIMATHCTEVHATNLLWPRTTPRYKLLNYYLSWPRTTPRYHYDPPTYYGHALHRGTPL